jgi:hypothetical protein
MGEMIVDETPIHEQVQELTITSLIVIEKEQLTEVNLGIAENVQLVKVNASLEPIVTQQLIELLKEFKDVFAWTYKDLKGIPPKIAQHKIELDTTIPLAHRTRYRLNVNYITIVKQDIDKLLAIGFIKPVE